MATSKPRGLFRWAGGKSHLVERIAPLVRAHVAATGGRLISLFHGGGAIERALGGAAVAADASPELLQLFADLQAHSPDELHAALLTFDKATPRTPEAYKAAGRIDPKTLAPLMGTARFVWLQAMAFNGIWRVNGDGQMNMGVDRARLARADVLPPVEAFASFAEGIKPTRFVVGWPAALALARPGDVVMADPPYGEFDGYTADGFDARDHRLLAGALRDALAGGMAIIGFNAPGAATLYHWAKVEELTRSGCVSSKATERDPVAEIVITAGLSGSPSQGALPSSSDAQRLRGGGSW